MRRIILCFDRNDRFTAIINMKSINWHTIHYIEKRKKGKTYKLVHVLCKRVYSFSG